MELKVFLKSGFWKTEQHPPSRCLGPRCRCRHCLRFQRCRFLDLVVQGLQVERKTWLRWSTYKIWYNIVNIPITGLKTLWWWGVMITWVKIQDGYIDLVKTMFRISVCICPEPLASSWVFNCFSSSSKSKCAPTTSSIGSDMRLRASPNVELLERKLPCIFLSHLWFFLRLGVLGKKKKQKKIKEFWAIGLREFPLLFREFPAFFREFPPLFWNDFLAESAKKTLNDAICSIFPLDSADSSTSVPHVYPWWAAWF